MSELVGQQLGTYRLIKCLGRGGFADVYLGEHIYLDNKKAAIKVLRGAFTKQDIEKFLEEAKIIHGLKNFHIVDIIDFNISTINGQEVPFLVMEYAPFGSLRQEHPRGARLSLATIISYVKPIAEALQYAHNQKVIHRDIKPANILLGENKKLLLSDFGNFVIAHRTQSMPPQDTVGTWPYMAPEQFIGEPRLESDQYALGVVVYEWLCGEHPFTGPSFDLYAYQHTNVAPPPLGKNVFPSVEAVVLRALAKEPKQRFATVQEFAQTLEHAYIEGITTCLDTPERAAEFLVQEGVQQALLDRILKEPNWWDTFAKPRIIALQQHRASSTLEVAFTRFAQYCIPFTLVVMQEDTSLGENPATDVTSASMLMLDMLSTISPLAKDPYVWLTLLRALLANKKALAFVISHWSIHAQLLRALNKVYFPSSENNELMRPLLSLKWDEFGEFLSLDLHKEWNWIATTLLSKTTDLTPTVTRNLEQKYASQVANLFKELGNEPPLWPIAEDWFALLVANGYTGKMQLLSVLLDSPKGQEHIQTVIKIASLTPSEIVLVLERYGKQFLRSYEHAPQLATMILKLFTILVKSEYLGKMDILFELFDSQTSSDYLEQLLVLAQITQKESIAYLQRYGSDQRYISFCYRSNTVLQMVATQWNWKMLSIWFNSSMSQVDLEKVLETISLGSLQKIIFLERFGEKYLRLYPQSSILLTYIRDYLRRFDISKCIEYYREDDYIYAGSSKEFFDFLMSFSEQLPLDIQAYIRNWNEIISFLVEPSANKAKLTIFASAFSQLSSAIYSKLLFTLARAFVTCVEDEIDLIVVVHSMSSALPSDTVLLLCRCMAVIAGGRFRNKLSESLIPSYVHFALTLEKIHAINAVDQEGFIQEFLDALLKNIDQSTIESITEWNNWWSPKVSARWKNYISKRNSKHAIEQVELDQGASQSSSISQTTSASIRFIPTCVHWYKSHMGRLASCLIGDLSLRMQVGITPQSTRPRKKFGSMLAFITISIILLTTVFGRLSYVHQEETAAAYLDATATASALAHATATASTLAHATATALTVIRNPYPSYLPGNGTLALYDPLSQPDDNWNNTSNSSFGGACQFAQGAYQVSQSKPHRRYPCYNSLSNFSNFAFEVQMTIIKGDCGGIEFRRDGAKGSTYLFTVCQDGYYGLYRLDYTGENTKTLASGSSSAINGYNQANVIAVVANRDSLDLYVNTQKIVNVHDETYRQGQIDIFADDSSNPTEVIYKSAKVWTCSELTV